MENFTSNDSFFLGQQFQSFLSQIGQRPDIQQQVFAYLKQQNALYNSIKDMAANVPGISDTLASTPMSISPEGVVAKVTAICKAYSFPVQQQDIENWYQQNVLS